MPKSRFKRLGLFYLIALGGIALSIIISQFLIQSFISKQQDDSRVVNVAGRQRMLSQQISKLSLQIAASDSGMRLQHVQNLETSLRLWKNAHQGLQFGNAQMELTGANSATIKAMFAAVEPHFQAMVTNADSLIAYLQSTAEPVTHDKIQKHVNEILAHEAPFLKRMDDIVYRYDAEAREKVSQLRETEIILLVISLLIILLELLFIFRPIARNVRETVLELTNSETASKKLASELSKLYEELGKSYQDLEAVNIEPESPVIFASMTRDGRFNYFSPHFHSLMEYEEETPPITFQQLLQSSGYKEDFARDLFKLLDENKNWSGEIKVITEPGDFCWLEAFLIPVDQGKEIKVIARDITEFKEAKMRSREINRERIEKSVKEQNYRSRLILEGQEEERKRLSRELHDGVGQMLSAMKLQLESITPSSSQLMKNRLKESLGLMKSIIQEVRRVSFNLTPSSLDDFGLVPAVKNFCEEIDAVTKTKIHFVNETRFINRLDSAVETNLYRIIQEAVNNALKYAKASEIIVKFSHNINSLNIVITDNGKGFDYDRVDRSGHFEKVGHGIFNMKERAAFIGGVFKLETELGTGTQIFITLSLD